MPLKDMKRLLFFSIGVLCLVACSSASRKTIVRAEQLLDSRPDSALLVLNGLSSEDIHPRSLRARYAMALTTAQYKNYIDVQDDSLIGPAYDYYHRFGTPENRMKAAFYSGVVKQNRGQTIEASYLFNEASTLAGGMGEDHYLGLASEYLSALYSENYDYQSAYEYAQKSARAFDGADERLSADFSRLDMARALFSLGKKKQAIRIVDSLLTRPGGVDAGLCHYLYGTKADFLYMEQDYYGAEKYYEQAEVCGAPLGLPGLGRKAVIMEMTGRSADADICMESIARQMRTAIDSTVYYDCLHEISLHRGDIQTAYQSKRKASSMQNRSVASLLDRSITHSQRAYFEERYSSERSQKWMLLLICVLVAVVLLSAILVFLILLRKRKMQIVEEMEKVEGINQDMQLLQEKQKGAGAILSSLVQDKIRLMQKLTDSYFSWTDEALYLRERMHGKAMKEDVISEFRSTLRALRNDEHFIPSLEKTLDISSQNLMTRLRETFSGASEHKMKEMDFKMLALFFSGFTPKSISFIMDMTEESVRTRKSRYKKLFLSLGDTCSDFAERLN